MSYTCVGDVHSHVPRYVLFMCVATHKVCVTVEMIWFFRCRLVLVEFSCSNNHSNQKHDTSDYLLLLGSKLYWKVRTILIFVLLL